MKKKHFFALVLVMAILAINCTAFTEELTIDLPDGYEMVLSDDTAIDNGEDTIVHILDEGEIPVEEIELQLSSDLADVSLDDVDSNDKTDGNFVFRYKPQLSYDNDALFAAYVEQLFYGKDLLGLKPNGWLGDRLTGVAADVYDHLGKQITKIARGKLQSTDIAIPVSIISGMTEAYDFVNNDFARVLDALLLDSPLNMYWYDKTEGIEAYIDSDDALHLCFAVAEEYASGVYKTDIEKILSVDAAHQNALRVARLYDGLSDYKKLCGYRDFICSAVDYNYDAASSTDLPYGNPWQMIWVFDGDPETNVVCEGYAKAFQFLCSKGEFKSNIQSHIVYGEVADSEGSSDKHMWNLITMEDQKNYHVDVTFYDGGFTQGFLAGATEQGGDVYTIADQINYIFDDDILDIYPANTLKLATENYDPSKYEPKSVTIKQGDTATLYMGNKLTLKAVVKPKTAVTKLKWSTNAKDVATVSQEGVVTPKKAGRAKITVTTDNKLSASIIVKVVDASSVKLKKGSTTLKKGKTISLKPGKSLTLKAVVSPSEVKTKLKWTSSNKNVTVKNGKVKVKATAKVGIKARITVKTANGKSTYVYIKVV